MLTLSVSFLFYSKIWIIERERLVDLGEDAVAGRERKRLRSITDCVSA